MTDYQLDSNDDLVILNGDWAIGPADNDNIRLLVSAIPGQIRHAPKAGWAAVTKLNGNVTQQDISDLRQQLANDGYPTLNINYDGNQLNIS